MRFARINTVAPEYIRFFYGQHPHLRYASYGTQFNALMWDSYMQPDSYTHQLKELGYECLEVVANIPPLQKRWCLENGFRWNKDNFVHSVPLDQLRRFAPEIVLAVNYTIFTEPWVRKLKECCPSVRQVLSWCGVNLDTYRQLCCFDVVLTCNEHLCQEMRRQGVNARVVPFAFDQRILERINRAAPATLEITFAGSVRRNDGFHGERARFLEQISEEFELILFTDNRTRGVTEVLGRRMLFDLARLLPRLGLTCLCRLPGLRNAARWPERPKYIPESPLWRTTRAGVYGLEYFQTLHDSKMSLNVHPNCAGWAASNIRLFEATGMGTCLVTDWKENLSRFFEPDREIVAFRTCEECLEKLRWLRDHPNGRKAIAEAGQRRTLREHTYARVAAAIDEIVAPASSRDAVGNLARSVSYSFP